MSKRRMLKLIHFFSTAWFLFWICWIVVSGLRQAGIGWWVIFTLSGHSAVLVFLLISLYLFAIFRGVARNQKTRVECPFTSTTYYMVFYNISPFLGGLAGCIAMVGTANLARWPLSIAMGTFLATFLAWIVVDPAIGLVEMVMPASRKHRRQRIVKLKAIRRKEVKKRRQFLADLKTKENQDQQYWRETLEPVATDLAELVKNVEINSQEQTKRKVVDMGVFAWQTGGAKCMQHLYEMATDICRRDGGGSIDNIAIWWDGIGNWRYSYPMEKVG